MVILCLQQQKMQNIGNIFFFNRQLTTILAQKVLKTPIPFIDARLLRCEKEEDLAMIAAQQYFIEYGTDMNSDRLLGLLPNYIPDYCLTADKPPDHWHSLIVNAFRKVCVEYLLEKPPPIVFP